MIPWGGGSSLSDTISQKANDSDVVHKTGNETISGSKTFSSGKVNLKPSPDSADLTTAYTIVNTRYARGESPTESLHNSFRVIDKNNTIVGEFCVENITDGFNKVLLNVRNTDSTGAQVYSSIYLDINKDGTERNFYPSAGNLINLGTASRKWKDVNTTLLNGKTPAYASDLDGKANDSDVVHKSGNETVNGAKTFTSTVKVSKSSGEGSLRAVNEQSGNIYLYANDTSRGLHTQNPDASFNHPIIHVNASDNKINLYADYVKSGPNKIDCGVEEQGDNYIRYSNGLQMCWVYAKMEESVYTWSFPKTFSQNPVITATIHYPSNDFDKYQRSVEVNNLSNTGVLLRSANHLFGSTAIAVGRDYVNAIAIGKWK